MRDRETFLRYIGAVIEYAKGAYGEGMTRMTPLEFLESVYQDQADNPTYIPPELIELADREGIL